MSAGSAIKISKRSIPARLGEREREGEEERRARERTRSSTQLFSNTPILRLVQAAGRAAGAFAGAEDNAHPSDPTFVELRSLRTQRGFIRIKASRTRAHGAFGTIQKLEKLLSVLHLRAVCGEKRSRSAAFTHGDPELDRRALASGRRMLIGEWNAPLSRAPRAAEVNIAAMWMLC